MSKLAYFSIWMCCCAGVNICKRQINRFQPADGYVSLYPVGWCEPSCQSSSQTLDVVSHFLWASLATAYGFAGVWEKSGVKEKRGSVYLSLLVGHDFRLWSDQLLDCLVGNRSLMVTVSAMSGRAQCLGTSYLDETVPTSGGIAAGGVKICWLLLHCKWLTGHGITFM